MPDETTPTFEVAKRCPKCDMPGEDMGASPAKNQRGQNVAVHSIFCRNPECIWYNTNWIVQVNPDGSVPKPYSQLGNKKFPKLSPESVTRVQEAIAEQLKAETSPQGLEVRNPNG